MGLHRAPRSGDAVRGARATWALPAALAGAAALTLAIGHVVPVAQPIAPAPLTVDRAVTLACPSPRKADTPVTPVTGGVRWGDGAVLTWAACTRPTTDGWLVLTDATDADIELVNEDEVDAQVDLTLLTGKGLHRAAGTTNITVPAGGRRVVPVSVQLPGKTPFAARVVASRGRVAAHARVAGRGFEDVLAAAPARTRQQLPVVPQGGRSSLLLANPASTPVRVAVQAHGQRGVFTPAGTEQLEVPAQGVLVVDVTKGFSHEAGALTVSGEGPVAAALQVRAGDDDLALVAATEAGTELRLGQSAGQLLVTNPGTESAWVSITGTKDRVRVPAGATRVLTVAEDSAELTSDQPVVAGTIVAPTRADHPVTGGALAVASGGGGQSVEELPGLVNDPTLR